uniref:NADH-ubiquinone oxidoreductase chain 6 n=1 Tax=Cheirotonus jansoni TaxID=1297118 RepID=V9MH45_9SCAR|nr:NADH dehydrogenase subunit 6 [Cheirotonus jansoni]AGG19636.1 NADH dehydrogenase subunit 6 [Cheirotonus jansoni]
MIKLLMAITLLNSALILTLKHPLSMGLTLLAQTITITLTSGFLSYNYWFSYILFLILIGGMLVLFIYMTSVASNEKFNYSLKSKMTLMLTGMILIPITMINPLFTHLSTTYQETLDLPKSFNLTLNKFFNTPSNALMYMMIIYLLVTLIAIVTITKIKAGPLRHSN